MIATNGVINFSELDPDMKASSVTDVAGATVQGNAFVGITGDKVTYKYKTGFQETSINVTFYAILFVKKGKGRNIIPRL